MPAPKTPKPVKAAKRTAPIEDRIALSYSVRDPNFSIVLPGGCNARCAFCFEGAKKKCAKPDDYMDRLAEVLDNLPAIFTSVSITGGEPTLSPYFTKVIRELATRRDRFPKIVLTTNGTALSQHMETITGVVDHVNLSRHHHDDDENLRIFNNGKLKGGFDVSIVDVHRIIQECSTAGIDVTANCVFNLKTSSGFFPQYVDWARKIGFSAIHFRKENGNNVVPANWKKAYGKNRVVSVGGCPVCRTTWILDRGMRVALKTSVLEPDTALKATQAHELIFLANGVTYIDWAGTRDVRFEFGTVTVVDPNPKKTKSAMPTALTSVRKSRISASRTSTGVFGRGCGLPTSGCGSGGGSCGRSFSGGCR